MNFIAIFLKDKTLKSGLFFAIYSIVVTILRLFMSEFISESKLFKKNSDNVNVLFYFYLFFTNN